MTVTDCRMYEAKYPEADVAVMVQVKSIAEMGAYVSLLEYNGIEGMILLSELSRRRIRSIGSLIKVGRQEPVMVLRVDKEKGYIDLSKRRVSEEDIQACEERYNKSKMVHSIMRHVAETLDTDLEDLYVHVGWPLYRKYGHAFEAFKLVVTDPDSVFGGLTREVKEIGPDGQEVTKVVPSMSEEVKQALIKNIRRRMTPQPLRIRADIELRCFQYDGVLHIQDAMRKAEAAGSEEYPVKIKLVAPPLYVLTTQTLDKEQGISVLNVAIKECVNPCQWLGVSCSSSSESRVIGLQLSGLNLTGTLSDDIGMLTHLQMLNLSANSLYGTIPKALANCTSLQKLDLSSNSLTGTIPFEVGSPQTLQLLDLSQNLLSGAIPIEIGSFQSLQVLTLFDNFFNGSIPAELGHLGSLRQLSMFSNNLTGSIPASLGNLKQLTLLRVGANELIGPIPPELRGCESLETLGLTQNKLEGEIPPELGELKNLTMLALWRNDLWGGIPPHLGNLSNLQTLALYDDGLTGEIPPELGKLQKLENLFLYRNSLNGSIPWQLGNCSNILELDLSMNELTGDIPIELGHLQAMKLLQLFQNGLTGSIPTQLGGLASIQKMDLSYNSLTGKVPWQLQSLPNLQLLQLGYNNLTGSLPSLFGCCSNLTVLDVSFNNISGGIPGHICTSGQLKRLNMGSNMLTGQIPDGVKSCYSLTYLSLYQNGLSGVIPWELSRLDNLSFLDISHNQFVGSIPPEFGSLKNLQNLIVSGNRLSGQLPSELGKLSKMGLFQASGNALNGTIPVELANCTRLLRLDLSINSLTGSIPSELSQLYQLDYLILSGNNLTGSIPSSLSNLTHLLQLDLGGNFLNGTIPAALGQLTTLQYYLSLRNNNLTGHLPEELGQLQYLNYLYLDNNMLTGEIPKSYANLTSLIVFNVSNNRLTGPIPDTPSFKSMNVSNFIGNMGLCGGSLSTSCGVNYTFPQASDAALEDSYTRVSIKAIVGIVAGVITGAVLMIIMVACCITCRRRSCAKAHTDDEHRYVEESYFATSPGFSFQDILEATDNFAEGYMIGRGACGVVYKAKLPSGDVIAVKKLASQREGSALENSFNTEIETLGKIRHGNIVKLYGFCYDQDCNLLLYEYMSEGSLGEHLHQNWQNCVLDWERRYEIALGAAEGLSYLHHDCKPPIVHRDIKCNNILLDHNLKAHVGDFGLAKLMDVPYSKSMSVIAGSYGYIAPEYAYTMKITSKCDVYSFGVVLLELVTGKLPVQSVDQGGDLVTWVRSCVDSRKELTHILDPRLDLKDPSILAEIVIVLKISLLCTTILPIDRPSMREVVCMLIGARNDEYTKLSITNRMQSFTLEGIDISNISIQV